MANSEETPLSETPSLLGNLAAVREEIANELVLELEVPRWFERRGIHIIVQYHPLEHSYITSTRRAVERAKGSRGEAELHANADLLIKACAGIYAQVNGQKYSLNPEDRNGEYTTFDDDLGANLGVRQQSARAVCRALFLTDGDLIAQADRLVEWSGYSRQQADEDFAGE